MSSSNASQRESSDAEVHVDDVRTEAIWPTMPCDIDRYPILLPALSYDESVDLWSEISSITPCFPDEPAYLRYGRPDPPLDPLPPAWQYRAFYDSYGPFRLGRLVDADDRSRAELEDYRVRHVADHLGYEADDECPRAEQPKPTPPPLDDALLCDMRCPCCDTWRCEFVYGSAWTSRAVAWPRNLSP